MKLRIATWNVERPSMRGWKRPRRNPIIIGQIQKIKADIWILTETHQVISPGNDFTNISTERADIHKEGERRVMIWSRYPITQQLATFDPTVAVCGDIETSVGNLRVYGTIITWAHNKGPEGKSKMWDEHYESIGAHGNDWVKLSQPVSAFCAAGDFNETLNELGWYGTSKGREMMSHELKRNNLECLTKGFRIDHICVTKGWVNQAEVHRWSSPEFDGKPVSDHPGYYVDLYFGE